MQSQIVEVLLKFFRTVAQHHDNVFHSSFAEALNATTNNSCFAEREERFERAHALGSARSEKDGGN